MKKGNKKEAVNAIEYKESRDGYMEEIKKKLPEIKSLEAMKAVYSAVVICIENETMKR